jgi:hypothetical protein
MSDRVFARAEMWFRLRTAAGGVSPKELDKRWFFELPAARDTQEAWAELLHRIVYDSNVRLRRQEPMDAAWIELVRFTTERLDPAAMLAWDGDTRDGPGRFFPWLIAEQRMVWEPGPCYFIDEAGRYDVMGANDHTELMLWRLLDAGGIDRAGFLAFCAKYFPGKPGTGEAFLADRATRLANLVTIRPASGYRKAPGSTPVASGPIDPSLIP